MARCYHICHSCKKIVSSRITTPMDNDEVYCSCGSKTERIIDHPKIPNIDYLYKGIGAELVYYSTGGVVADGDEFVVNLPLFRFKDNAEGFVSKNLYLRNARLSFDKDSGIYDLFYPDAETRFNTQSKAEKALNKYNAWIKIALDYVYYAMPIKNTSKSRYVNTSNACNAIRDSDRKKVYYCPGCGNIGVVTVNTGIGSYMINQDIRFTKPVSVSEIRVHNNIRCIQCDDLMVEIDFDISAYIERMNNVGIKTIYCCQGHYTCTDIIDSENGNSSKYGAESPYILFYANRHDNAELIGIVCDLINDSKYKYLDLEFVDEDNYESAEYSRVYIFGVIDGLDKEKFKLVQSEFIDFLNDLLTKYEAICK